MIANGHLGSYSDIMPRRKPGSLFPLEVDVLETGVALQLEDGSFYGFSLARRLAEPNGGAFAAHGTLYKALSRMTEAGLLEATWEDAEISEGSGRPRRRLYRVTGEGEQALARAKASAQAASPAQAKGPSFA
jgi:PadR family transcriptional regulator PadR